MTLQQKQLQISNIKPSNIKKIFLTHLHGDHCFGLAGTLCMIGQSQDDQSNEDQIIDIYGPEGELLLHFFSSTF